MTPLELEQPVRISDERKARRGFAVMGKDRRREISSQGGKAVHAQGRARTWTDDEAQAAGRKGGRRVSADRAHMAAIGRKGGTLRWHRARLKGVRV